MFATSSVSAPTLADKLLAQVGRDVSVYPSWFAMPFGLDFSFWQVVEFPRSDSDITVNALQLPKGILEVRPLPRPVSVFTPRTELASCLWEIRKRIVSSGEFLLDWDDIQKEIADRRTERG